MSRYLQARPYLILVVLALVSLACRIGEFASPDPTASPLPTHVSTRTPSPTFSFTATSTSIVSPSPTTTPSPSPTGTPTLTLTPTSEFSQGSVREQQAFCRYGPGRAYLYSHGLYAGDRVEIHGRNPSGTWLWVQPENLERHCWAAASVMEITGDPLSAPVVHTQLPRAAFYYPPENVQAFRQGDRVIVSWDRVPMTEDDDRGYLIEAFLCQGGVLIWVAIQTNETSYAFTDEPVCGDGSGGLLYTVEKHGYTEPVRIPWP